MLNWWRSSLDPAYGFPYHVPARILAILGLPLSLFGILEATGDLGPLGRTPLIHTLLLSTAAMYALNVLGAGIGFRWAGPAGGLFLASGLGQLALLAAFAGWAPAFGVQTMPLVFALVLPTLATGALFLAAWRKERAEARAAL